MSEKITRKALKQDEFVDAASDVGEWLEKHRRTVVAVAAAIVGAVVFWAGWTAWSHRRVDQARRELAAGLSAYEPQASTPGQLPPPPRYPEALAAFEKAERAGGASAAGQVASFYRGATLLRMGRPAEAVPLFEGVASRTKDRTLAGTARLSLAQALVEAGQGERAIGVLRDLVKESPALYPEDFLLMRIARTQQRLGKMEDARRSWTEVVTRFPSGDAVGEARTLLKKHDAASGSQ